MQVSMILQKLQKAKHDSAYGGLRRHPSNRRYFNG